MSTRSGRRIHSSFHESTVKAEAAPVPNSERKTRGKRQKESDVNLDVTVPRAAATAATKRQHYVTYPADSNSTDDEHNSANVELPPLKAAKKTGRNTLKELNADLPVSENNHPRLTRQTRKFVQNVSNQPTESVNGHGHCDGANLQNSGSKKSKKKKSKKENVKENADELEKQMTETSPNEGAKKKKNKKGSKIARQKSEERSNGLHSSVESYHTAAGSPPDTVLDTEQEDVNDNDNLKTDHGQLNGTFDKTAKLDGTFEKAKNLNGTFDKTVTLDGTFDKTEKPDGTFEKTKNLNGTFDKPNVISIVPESTSINRSNKKQRSKRKLSSMQAVDVPDGDLKSSPMNTTFVKNINSDTANDDKLNCTFEKSPKKRKSNNMSNSPKTENNSVKLNGTFDKSPKSVDTFDKTNSKLSFTFDKTDTKLNTTFEKLDSKLNATFDKSASQKSSLISSDRDSNVTFDKSDVSRISITSDEDSKTDNIVNTTPLLIESSIDESKNTSQVSINNSTRKSKSIDKSNITRTPLKRDSTFTKESPETDLNTTPPNASMSAAGSTPFHTSRSSSRVSHKDRSMLNVTRSIEKPSQNTTSEAAPSATRARQTRVMFSSPTSDPAVESTIKRKIIKSSMKGSNKTFIFEDNESTGSAMRPSALPAYTRPSATAIPAHARPSATAIPAHARPSATAIPAHARPSATAIPRKRSMTSDDADATRSKRTRLDANATLPRATRTRAATAQPQVKPPTPKQPSLTPRTTLPDFAALHQRRFAKMESLDECQQRKAQRAKQLLTPTSTRRTNTNKAEQPKSAKAVTNTPSSTVSASNPYTLESLRPGFTRFGFKMNSDVNPFSVPSKTDIKAKENQLKGKDVDKIPFSISKMNKTSKETTFTENNPFSVPIASKVKENMRKLKDKNIHKTPFTTGKSVNKNNENQFIIAMEKQKPKVKVAEVKNPQPSLTGTTAVRKEQARQIVMRERDKMSGKRERSRNEARVTIKGVRTNRRFELQMQMRNIE